jgi:hypothetical protein
MHYYLTTGSSYYSSIIIVISCHVPKLSGTHSQYATFHHQCVKLILIQSSNGDNASHDVDGDRLIHWWTMWLEPNTKSKGYVWMRSLSWNIKSAQSVLNLLGTVKLPVAILSSYQSDSLVTTIPCHICTYLYTITTPLNHTNIFIIGRGCMTPYDIPCIHYKIHRWAWFLVNDAAA